MADAFETIRAEVEQAVADPQLSPAEKVAKLREYRRRLEDIVSACARYEAGQEKAREAQAAGLTDDVLFARSNADLREQLIAAGDHTAEQLDEAGMLSHAELDRLSEEGLLEDAASQVARSWDA